MHKRINGLFCPPLGLTDRFNVTVVGAEWTWVGGCAYMQRYPSISPSQLFHLWLRRDGGVGHCGDLHSAYNDNNFITTVKYLGGAEANHELILKYITGLRYFSRTLNYARTIVTIVF